MPEDPNADVTLPNGDTMRQQEVDVLYEEAWANLGELQASNAGPARIEAAQARLALLIQTKFGGFGPEASKPYRDADRRLGMRAPETVTALQARQDAAIDTTAHDLSLAQQSGDADRVQRLEEELTRLYRVRFG